MGNEVSKHKVPSAHLAVCNIKQRKAAAERKTKKFIFYILQ